MGPGSPSPGRPVPGRPGPGRRGSPFFPKFVKIIDRMRSRFEAFKFEAYSK